MELSNEQQKIADDVLSWVNNSNKDKIYLTIGGYAGTGKTTLISYLKDKLLEDKRKIKLAFLAYTGKASTVLEGKLGYLDSHRYYIGTIHSILYRPEFKNVNGKKILIGFKRVRREEIREMYDLFIIDEGSMISKDIYEDLLDIGIPMIIVGDHGQLPPISSDNFNIMNHPQYKLEKIHRQVENHPIIKLSILARKDGFIPPGIYDKNVLKLPWYDNRCQTLFNSIKWNNDIICICGFNKTRIKLNKIIREKRGIKHESMFYPNDRIICLKNNKEGGIMNGQLGSVMFIMPSEFDNLYKTDLKIDDYPMIYSCYSNSETLNNEKASDLIYTIVDRKFYEKSNDDFKVIKKLDPDLHIDVFDFGYAITTHKSQGSEWEKVVLFEQRANMWDDEFYRRWLYTGVTRAKRVLFMITNF